MARAAYKLGLIVCKCIEIIISRCSFKIYYIQKGNMSIKTLGHTLSTKSICRLFTVISVLDEPLFWGPILMSALAHLAHMSQSQIFISEAFALVLVILIDTPLGAVADHIGRKKCVLIGKAFGLASIYMLATMTSMAEALIANTLWSIEVSLVGGAETALIYNTLQSRGEGDNRYSKLIASVLSWRFAVMATGGILTGLIMNMGANLVSRDIIDDVIRLPMLVSIPGVVIAFILTFWLPEEGVLSKTENRSRSINHLQAGYTELKRNKQLFSLYIAIALYMALSKAHFFTFNPMLERGQASNFITGALYSSMLIVAFMMNRGGLTQKIRLIIGRAGLSYAILWLGMIIMFQIILSPAYGMYVWCLQGVARGYANYIAQTESQSLIPRDHSSRATLTSMQSSLTKILEIIAFASMALMSFNLIYTLSVLAMMCIVSVWYTRKV